MMKAAVLHKVHDPLTIEDFEMPAISPDEVLIKVKACGVCHTDHKVIEGRIPSRMPAIIGHEVSGTIEEVGSSQRSAFKAGRCRHRRHALSLRPLPVLRLRPGKSLPRAARAGVVDAHRRKRDLSLERRRLFAVSRLARLHGFQAAGRLVARRSEHRRLPHDHGVQRGEKCRRDQARRFRSGDWLRRRRSQHDSVPAHFRRLSDHRRRCSRCQARSGEKIRRHPHRQRRRKKIRSKRCAT